MSRFLRLGCVRVQPHTALGVYGPTVHVIGRTVCHAMDGPSHAFANPVNVDIRRDFPRVFLSEWIGEVWSHDGVAGRHGKNHLPFRRSQLHIFEGDQRESIRAELVVNVLRVNGIAVSIKVCPVVALSISRFVKCRPVTVIVPE